MTDPEVAQALTDAARAIADAPTVALACHVNPDGDALGSMLGLFHTLRAAGRDVVASFPHPFVVGPHYRELPGLHLLSDPETFPREPDVMVTFDCGSLGRLGDLEPAAKAARELIVLDHHVSNTRYGTINVIDAAAAASGVIVRDLVRELGLPLTQDGAVALYAALVCDTGRFQYDTTTPEVFELARELVSFDVPVSRLSRQLFEEHTFAYLKLLGDALAAAELDVDRRFVWTAVTQDMLDRHGVTLEEVEGLIDIVRRATRSRSHLRREGRGRRNSAGQSALARRRRRPADRGRARRGRSPLRGRLRVDPRHPRRRRPHPRRALITCGRPAS